MPWIALGFLIAALAFAVRDFHKVCARLEQRQRNWGKR